MKTHISILIFVLFIFSCNKNEEVRTIPKTIIVPDEVKTIQKAIDLAIKFDTILVSAGIYSESLNFKGKAIYLASHYIISNDTLDIKNTIIDGVEHAVIFECQEDSSSIIDGFTITGCHLGNIKSGGAILIKKSKPSLKNLIIENNILRVPNSSGRGGGILCDSGGFYANNLKIRKNICGSGEGGGGIYASNSFITILNSYISENSTQIMEFAGGIYFKNVNFIILNSKIENNYHIKELAREPIYVLNSNGIIKNTVINDTIKNLNSEIKYINCFINNIFYP